MTNPTTDPTTDPTTGPADGVHTLHRYPEKLVVSQLGPGAEVPAWAESSSVFAVIATATETTLVSAGRSVPKKVVHAGPFTAFAVAGTLDLTLSGVLHGLLGPLAEEGISVFPLATYPTDWILVPTEKADAAADAWRRRGHTVAPAPLANS